MPAYHAAPARQIAHPSVKPAQTPDLRDPWRLRIATDPRLGARALRVALVLLNFANRDGYTSVGLPRLAAELGMDRRQVQRGLAALVAAGHLEREEGGGVLGRGGRTAGTWLKVAATEVAATVTAPPPEVAATVDRSSGHRGPEVAATVTAQTLLTQELLAADAPGLEPGSATARNGGTGSAHASGGGEVLRLGGELVAAPRVGPTAVGRAVLDALHARFGRRPERAGSPNENFGGAGTRKGIAPDAP